MSSHICFLASHFQGSYTGCQTGFSVDEGLVPFELGGECMTRIYQRGKRANHA